MSRLKNLISGLILSAGITGACITGFNNVNYGNEFNDLRDSDVRVEYNELRKKRNDLRKQVNEQLNEGKIDDSVLQELDSYENRAEALGKSTEMAEYWNRRDELIDNVTFNLMGFVASAGIVGYGLSRLLDRKRDK